ncbi:MAG: type IV pili methyl-accepting chemotaxis transducer N-terminal domain-containing protein, partial [Pseudomonadota bacterium]
MASIISVLSLNIAISTQFEADAVAVNIAGRQRMLSQRTVKNLQGIQLTQQAGGDISESFQELNSTFSLFDRTLTAFDQGGTTAGAGGGEVELAAVDIADGRTAIDSAVAIWSTYGSTIEDLVAASPATFEAVSFAQRVVRARNSDLLVSMNELTNALEAEAASPVAVNIAGRQRMLSQRIAKRLYELQADTLIDADLSADLSADLAALRSDAALFGSVLAALSDGGSVAAPDGSLVELAALTPGRARDAVVNGLILR